MRKSGRRIGPAVGRWFVIKYDDVIKWKHCPRYWLFVRGIHRAPVYSFQRPVTRSFDISFDQRLKKKVEETTQTPVIWDAIELIMASL